MDEQVNILDEELSRYPAALAISIADAKACEVQFDQAGWNGTPIEMCIRDRWYGVTYKEDKPVVMEAIRKMEEEGLYPA